MQKQSKDFLQLFTTNFVSLSGKFIKICGTFEALESIGTLVLGFTHDSAVFTHRKNFESRWTAREGGPGLRFTANSGVCNNTKNAIRARFPAVGRDGAAFPGDYLAPSMVTFGH